MKTAERDTENSAERFQALQQMMFPGSGDMGQRTFEKISRWPPEDWPRPNPGTTPTSVAIVGKSWGRYFAPWGKEGWEIWGLNETPKPNTPGIPPIEAHTRWFQLHGPEYMSKHFPVGVEQLERDWTRVRDVRLMMWKEYDEYPDVDIMPRERIESELPRGWYHASSFDWMVALAILEGFERIQLCGVPMTTPPFRDGEPLSARACLEYWIGVAEGRGIPVKAGDDHGDLFQIIHMAKHTSDLRYGYEDEPALDLSLENPRWMDWR